MFLNFDTWRKTGHKELLQAYVKTFEKYKESDVKMMLKHCLDIYTSVGSGTYDGSITKWNSAYIIARELAVYKEYNKGEYVISRLAEDLINSKITPSEYMANYILNFKQLVNNSVINPFFEILSLIKEQNIRIETGENLSIEKIIDIKVFNLLKTSEENGKNMVKNLCRRINDSKLMNYDEHKQELSYNGYKIVELKEACILWNKTVLEFMSLDHNGYVDMICDKNSFIY
ncbi:hypothetical protein FDB73_12925 [Clostridium botulinum]|nr:hypothetical protein [Clostridium botulinum]NFP54149.1 hypothetical protein [Clostridium botulinum]NFT11364.1 hypothetical protein [Clostridium botulinum]NFT62523.1 hypothetical protein [Clostridium botulinum]